MKVSRTISVDLTTAEIMEKLRFKKVKVSQECEKTILRLAKKHKIK